MQTIPSCSNCLNFPIDHLNQPPTLCEVLSAVQSLKNNKSPGIDNIPAELLKQEGYLCTRALH